MGAPFWYMVMIITWSTVYIESIRLGFKQKTYSIPLWAIGLNISWEFLSFYYKWKTNDGFPLESVYYLLWFLLDCFILLTYILYGRKYWPKSVNSQWFLPWVGLVCIITAGFQVAFIKEFGYTYGSVYAAYIQNTIMSICFMAMLVQRQSAKGQNLLIAISKMLGTFIPTIALGIIGMPAGSPNLLVKFLGLSCFVFDIIYIAALTHVIYFSNSRTWFSNIFLATTKTDVVQQKRSKNSN